MPSTSSTTPISRRPAAPCRSPRWEVRQRSPPLPALARSLVRNRIARCRHLRASSSSSYLQNPPTGRSPRAACQGSMEAQGLGACKEIRPKEIRMNKDVARRSLTIFSSNRAVLSLLFAAGAPALFAAPLQSPWDGEHVAITKATYSCPAIAHIAPDLVTDGFYRLDDPTSPSSTRCGRRRITNRVME